MTAIATTPATNGSDDRAYIRRLMDDRKAVFLIGDSGTGKSYEVEQYALSNDLTLSDYQGHDGLTFDDLCGRWIPCEGGGYRWVLGDLALRVRDGGLCLIDEAPACPASTLMALNKLANGQALTVVGPAETLHIQPHKDFVLALTGNPWKRYAGNAEMNPALLDRTYIIRVDYLPAHEEIEAVLKHQTVDRDILKELVQFAGEARLMRHQRASKSAPITTRTLIHMAYLIEAHGLSPMDAIRRTAVATAALFSDNEATAITTLASSRFGA
jgi:MoxR-like ATPase